MTERISPTQHREVHRGPGKIDSQTGEWRPLTADEFLNGEDISSNIEDLGIEPGRRSLLADMWDNFVLGFMKRDVVRERIQAQAFWDSHHTPERRSNALHVHNRFPELFAKSTG
jgi:hypothetical protein